MVKNELNCKDKHCPFHGNLSTRGRIFEGIVKRLSSSKTVIVEWPYFVYLPKYERYEKRLSRLKVHSPDCVNLKTGDKVKVMECRPISKTKHFVVLEKK